MASEARPDPRLRARVRTLADEALARGRPTAWFEALYREAGLDPARIPWADGEPNAAFAAWARTPGSLAGVRRAVVVGAGLGDDAELLAAALAERPPAHGTGAPPSPGVEGRAAGRDPGGAPPEGGAEVLAFDVSPTAVAWARRLHPGSRVRYEVADLLALPPAWLGTSDLIVEVYTLQALPLALRDAAARALASLLAPGGRLFLFTRLRDDGPGSPPYDERTAGPPWPLGRSELARLTAPLVVAEPLRELADPDDPAVLRGVGVWRRA